MHGEEKAHKTLLFTPRHSQSLLMEGFTALSALSAASQLIFAHKMALPTYIHAGRFSCEHEICPQNVRVNCNYKTRQK